MQLNSFFSRIKVSPKNISGQVGFTFPKEGLFIAMHNINNTVFAGKTDKRKEER